MTLARRTGAGMTLARARDGFAGGGWRCLVRFGFVGGNFLRRSVSIFAVMSMIAATATADTDANRTADSFKNIRDFISRARCRRWRRFADVF